METNQTPDFGELWSKQIVSFMPGTIEDHDGKVVNFREQQLRAIDCVAACAGMADPAKEIQAMREAIGEANDALIETHKRLDLWFKASGPKCQIKDAEALINAELALAKLQPHLLAKL